MPVNINNISKNDVDQLEMILFDFDGVFTNNKVYINQSGLESVVCLRSDGIGLARLRELGIKMSIISTEKNPVVSVRAKKLKIDCEQGISDKSITVSEICKKHNVSAQNTMFVGNDINDIPAFDMVGFAVGVKDSFNEILPHISYITNIAGGKGAVREICDVIYEYKKL
jgi:YrbI family 3-deoxy-D-manno-octulosonate 8-phosphate phosphatase